MDKFEDCILKMEVTFVLKFPELKEEAINIMTSPDYSSNIEILEDGRMVIDIIDHHGDGIRMLRGEVKIK